MPSEPRFPMPYPFGVALRRLHNTRTCRVQIQARLFVCVIVLLTSACQSLQTATAPESKVKQARVDGVTLNYLDEGQGVPVVFVHGAFSDRRNWETQRAAVSKQ